MAATLPAVSEASDVVSRDSMSPDGRDLLAVLVDEEDDFRVGVRTRRRCRDVLDLLEFLVVQDEIGNVMD